MGRAVIFILAFFWGYGNCSEIEVLDINLNEPYNVTCDITDIENLESCFLKNPNDQTTLWRDYTGRYLTLEEERIGRIQNPLVCGVEVQYPRKRDSGKWRCVVTTKTSDKSITIVKEIQVIVHMETPNSKLEENISSISLTNPKNVTINNVSLDEPWKGDKTLVTKEGYVADIHLDMNQPFNKESSSFIFVTDSPNQDGETQPNEIFQGNSTVRENSAAYAIKPNSLIILFTYSRLATFLYMRFL